MDYSVTSFIIDINDSQLLQPCREILTEIVAEAGYESFEDTDNGVNAYIQTTMVNDDCVRTLLSDFPMSGATITFHTEAVETEDWNAAWEENIFTPIHVTTTTASGITNTHCIIFDARDDDAPSLREEADIAIAIEQKMAFGTGRHETTQMIVRELLDTDLNGKRVLDCGCGTGILSLVAKRCGAEHVTAYDIDEWSVNNTIHNAAINDITLTDVLLGDVSVLTHVDGVFDIIVANINRNIILNDIEQIAETLNIGGKIIISGFYEEDAPTLLAKASTLGLYEASRSVNNGWTMLVLHR